MYYSSGIYEAFADPRKSEGVDKKTAHILGTGLAPLTAACYLVRDGQMPGNHIHIYEKEPIPGGACDGAAAYNCLIFRQGHQAVRGKASLFWLYCGCKLKNKEETRYVLFQR